MAKSAPAPNTETPRGDWARKYPPLMTMGVALLVALVVLPSALNLPQANPTETVEYAPVPPDDDSQDNQQGGNFGGLGLGRSAGIGSSSEGVDGEQAALSPPKKPKAPRKPPPLLDTGEEDEEGQAIDPGVRCTGQPARQTIDPLAPPCVTTWTGDNHGATYGLGVTGEEIRLLYYTDGNIRFINGSDASNQIAPSNELYDLMVDPAQNMKANGNSETQPEHLVVKGLRVWQEYFNERFQRYGRYVHFYVYFSGASTPEQRRADAAANFESVEPFAVITDAQGNEDDYLSAMARKGVLNFGSFSVRPQAFFARYPKLIWSYLPSAEQQIETYGSYLCQQVVGKPPVLASPELQAQSTLQYGGIRKLGLLWTDDNDFAGFRRMRDLVRETVEGVNGSGGCGGKFELEATWSTCCFARNSGGLTNAQQRMAEFKSGGITTIVWAGGIEGNFARAAAAVGYYPEWIVLGDKILDARHPNRLAENTNSFNGKAIVVSPQAFHPAIEQQMCYLAYREIDRTTPAQDLAYTCNFYRDLFQFFIGVQVAGPYLNPTSIDKGFHAIPQRYEGSPTIPACFYLPGDYTCVKDAAVYIWRAEKRAPGDDLPGCWEPRYGGKRFAPKKWPEKNIDDGIDPNAMCTGYDSRVLFQTT